MNLSFRFVLPGYLGVLLLLAACRGEDTPGEEGVAGRVLVVYLGGDSNLSGEAGEKLRAMREGWHAGDAPVIVYLDDASRGGSLLARLAGETLDTVAVYAEENSASPAVLRRVVELTRERYPARSYGLLLFSHASGWLPAGTLQDPLAGLTRSVIVDDGGAMRQEMEIDSLAAALPDGMFDFILFETCLTANVEVAHALRHKTAYIVASAAEILSPGFTPLYPGALADLLDTRGSLPDNLRAFAGKYFRHASESARYFHSATISLIHTAPLDDLALAARAVYREATGTFTGFDTLQRFDRPGMYDGDSPALARYFDLDHYIEAIASPAALAAFREAARRVVLYEESTVQFLRYTGAAAGNPENGFEITRHCGLTTYIERPEFPYINAEYRKTSWYEATR
jgi:hypothetical protein